MELLREKTIRNLFFKIGIFYLVWLFAISGLSVYAESRHSDQKSTSFVANEYKKPAKVTAKNNIKKPVKSKIATKKPAKTVNGGIWDKVAMCESSGDWHVNTGNGYYGGVQFKLSSWQAVGGQGYPHQATKSEQIKKAKKLKSIQGWQAWPECSTKLGLR